MPQETHTMTCEGLRVGDEAGRKGAEIVALVSKSVKERLSKEKTARLILEQVTELEADSGSSTAVEACLCAIVLMRSMLPKASK